MAEVPAGNEPVPSSDGKQRLMFSRIFCVVRLARLWVHCSWERRERDRERKIKFTEDIANFRVWLVFKPNTCWKSGLMRLLNIAKPLDMDTMPLRGADASYIYSSIVWSPRLNSNWLILLKTVITLTDHCSPFLLWIQLLSHYSSMSSLHFTVKKMYFTYRHTDAEGSLQWAWASGGLVHIGHKTRSGVPQAKGDWRAVPWPTASQAWGALEVAA